MKRPHIVIIGGGFGGLSAAKALKGANADVTVIDRTNHHLFQPLLYQVATASLSPRDITAPIRHVLRHQQNTSVLLAEVRSDRCRAEGRSNRLSGTRDAYDYLIVAVGIESRVLRS